MKKFQFTLSRVQDYRGQILDEEKGVLAVFRQERELIEAHIEDLEREFANLSREMEQEQRRGIPAFRLQAYSAQFTNIRRQLEQLRKDRLAAELKEKKQMSVVVQASQEVSKLDKLYEKQLDIYNKGVQKAEEQFIEEFISTKRARQSEELT